MTTQDAVSGPQREPDERVREALEWADKCPNNEDNATYLRALAAEVRRLRRLQAAQREPVAWIDRDDLAALQVQQDNLDSGHLFYPPVSRWKTVPGDVPLYTQAQRDDHPPDLEHPRSRETAAESLSVDTSVAERCRWCGVANPVPEERERIDWKAAANADREAVKDAERYRWLRDCAPFGDKSPDCCPVPAWCEEGRVEQNILSGEELDAAIDAAMSADVRSQAKGKS